MVYVVQDRLLFMPSKALGATPAAVALEFDDVWIETSDGERLHGWWIPHERSRGTIAFFHGNAGNIANRLDFAAVLHQLRVDVLLIDYRGFGQSSGRPTEEGLYRDGEAVWDYLTEERGVPPSAIVLHGRSLGSGVATYLAARKEPGAVILESAFTTIRDAAAYHYPWLPVRLLMRARFDNLSQVNGLRSPLLILHGRRDEVVPFEQGERLYEAASEPKHFVELDGLHNDGYVSTGDRYIGELSTFLETYLRSRAA